MPNQDPLLTRREMEILQLVGKAYSSKEIGEQLFISINTVENHRKRMFQKMDVKYSRIWISFKEWRTSCGSHHIKKMLPDLR